MNYISDIMYWISTGLLVPVIILLIFLFIRAILLIGSFFGQYAAIRKTEHALRQSFKTLTPDTIDALSAQIAPKSPLLIIKYIHEIIEAKHSVPQIDHLLAEFELAADKDLGISKVLTKMGPMLGLMGTLIPMGPALVGLASGDIASMAYNMQVAFATTVVGLFASAVGFITQQIKQRWYLQDMSHLELLVALIKEKKSA